jgi:hypothetical protein
MIDMVVWAVDYRVKMFTECLSTTIFLLLLLALQFAVCDLETERKRGQD